jgi:hypothetical protein
MSGRMVAVTTLLCILTACRQEQLSLPVTHASGTEVSRVPVEPATTQQPNQPQATESCYSYILLRPREQRATAVQARLKKADQMTKAFAARKVTVDLVGDHANVLSVRFPSTWPDASYTDRISAVIEQYFSSQEVEDYMCSAGFDEVRLSARGLKDGRIHPIWTAHVTSVGLIKDPATEEVAKP